MRFAERTRSESRKHSDINRADARCLCRSAGSYRSTISVSSRYFARIRS